MYGVAISTILLFLWALGALASIGALRSWRARLAHPRRHTRPAAPR